jgi:hypothetical protein
LNIKHEPEEIIFDVIEDDRETIEQNREDLIVQNMINRKKFFCDHCTKSYGTKNGLKMHMKKHLKLEKTSKIQVNQYCELCKKTVRKLSTHLEVFHTNVTHFCDLCDFSSKYRANMISHKESVRNLTNFKLIYKSNLLHSLDSFFKNFPVQLLLEKLQQSKQQESSHQTTSS